MTIDGRLYSLRRNDGVVRWIVDLPGALPKRLWPRKISRDM